MKMMTQSPASAPLEEVANYYAAKLAEHGMAPRGVDWNGEDGQILRFAQLSRIIDHEISTFSVNDLGCGYGALYDFLVARYPGVAYHGIDVAEEMVQAARTRLAATSATFARGDIPDRVTDYGIASGIFNIRLQQDDDAWRAHMQSTLNALDRTSTRGFAFNCLTSWSDPERMRSDLFYANPAEWFDFCKRRYARNVALLHDYGLYEFTILVRKMP